ncbi:efflux RND transporter permease subunit [bacterium]|nr:MAG: efflux RND transporter permease subunit [bacterium]
MQKLSEICISRPVFAWVLMLILVVVGVAGYTRMGVDRNPNVDIPMVSISTTSAGSSAEAVEQEITNPIEDAVSTISGVDTVTSTSVEGNSSVRVEFDLSKDVNVAAEEVRGKVNGILGKLPDTIDSPVVTTFDPNSNPVITFALSSKNLNANSKGDNSLVLRDLTEYADKTLSDQIQSVSGVGEVSVSGGRARQINVLLDPYRMRSYGITTNTIILALQAQNAEVPGGQVEEGARSLTLRASGRLTSVSDFKNVRLQSTQNGGIIRLGNVAQIEDGTEDATSSTELNGKPAVQISIRKQSGQNTLSIVDSVKERVKELEKTLPPGYEMTVVSDDSSYIEAAVDSVKEHLLVGSLLATVVVFIFLMSWRSTLISAVSIPISIVAAFGFMWMLGFTLNTITLLALTLAVGIVIDDAIVVLENIHRLMDEEGFEPREAAVEGTKQIGLAVLATTLSLVAVFLPVAFMSGIVGRFMNSFGITMSIAILISMLVSFSLTPMMCSRMLKPSKKSESHAKGSHSTGGHGSQPKGLYGLIDKTYVAALKWSMGHRWVIVLACVGALAAVLPLGIMVPKNFIPSDDESQVNISFSAPLGTSLEATQQIARRMSEEVRRMPGVRYTLVTSGSNNNLNDATITVRMKDLDQRDITQDQLVERVRSEIMPHFKSADLRAIVSGASAFGGGGRNGAQIQFVISGPSLTKLIDVSQKALVEFKKVPGVVDADTSLNNGKPELQVQVDRDLASQLNVSPSDVASALRYFVGGAEVTTYNEGGEQYEVHLRAQKQFRTGTAGIGLLTVPSSTLTSVPLQQVVKFGSGTGPSQIEHTGGRPQVTLSSNLTGNASQAEVMQKLQAIVDKMNLGPDYTTGSSGMAKQQGKASGAFLSAILLSFVFMYLILAAQFESWIHPVTILLSLPLTIPFALLSLVLFNQSLNIYSMLGILVLFGIVKKNSILQIDHTNQLREKGLSRYDAIIQANRDRLRPILMTTLAFVAGMVPLLISQGTGSGTNHSIGTVIFGGQTFSLALTLLATPVAYSLFDDAAQWLSRTRTNIASRFARPSQVAPSSGE